MLMLFSVFIIIVLFFISPVFSLFAIVAFFVIYGLIFAINATVNHDWAFLFKDNPNEPPHIKFAKDGILGVIFGAIAILLIVAILIYFMRFSG